MARILIAWELGHGLGHVTALRSVADRLLGDGHEVIATARDLLRLRRGFAGSNARLMAAPFFPGVVIPPGQLSSLSDVLWHESAGHSGEAFAALFDAWREMVVALKPDLLIADAAQMALAGAAGLLPCIDFVHYFHASDARAWGVFRDWERVDAAACERRAENLLAHLNEARSAHGLDAVESLHEGFSADRHLFRILSELDYRGPREKVRYLGQVVHPGVAPEWPAGTFSRRLFAYLRRDYEHLDRVLGALQRLDDCAVLCFHDGIPENRLKRASHLAYSTAPLDLGVTLPDVDVVLCHGGGVHALAAQFGKPALLLPLHTEHFLSARAAAASGLARVMSPVATRRPDVLAALRELLDDADCAVRARDAGAAQRQRVPDPLQAFMEEANALLH